MRVTIEENLVDVELLPERRQDVHAPVGPRVADAEVVRRARLRPAEDAQDALGEAPQHLAVDLVGPAEVVDDLGHSAATGRVPGVLRELVVADLGAVRVAALRGAQVHA